MAATTTLALMAAALITTGSTAAPAPPGPERTNLSGLTSQVYPLVFQVEDLAGTQRETQSASETKYTLQSSLLFAKDSSRISQAARSALDDIARKIAAARPAQPVKIMGYTDDLGSAEHGLKLSKERATAVKVLLQKRPELVGVTYTTEGHGEARPIADNGTEAGRRRNRRVEIVVAASTD
ncbi:OmpA family protein [Streptomyces sp. NPDC059783]|uniref:OmpA family protein n=1 Tax=Streptomyces sp. NPDC059783 TaxID=3346944 RepID=UPI0036601C93